MLKESIKEERKTIKKALEMAKYRMNVALVRGALSRNSVRDAEFLIMVSSMSQMDTNFSNSILPDDYNECGDAANDFLPVGSLVRHVLDSRRGVVIGRDARNELITGDCGESSRQSHYHVIWDLNSKDVDFSSSDGTRSNDILHSYVSHDVLVPVHIKENSLIERPLNLSFGVNKAPLAPAPPSSFSRESMNIISGTFSAPSAISNPLMGHFFREIHITPFATNPEEKHLFSDIRFADADTQQPYLVFTRYVPQSPIHALYQSDFLSTALPEAIAQYMTRSLAPNVFQSSAISNEVRMYPHRVLHSVYDRLVHRPADKEFDSLVTHGLFSGILAYNATFSTDYLGEPSSAVQDSVQLTRLTDMFLHCVARERQRNCSPVHSTKTSSVRQRSVSMGPEQEKTN